jgi:hypothetical protein
MAVIAWKDCVLVDCLKSNVELFLYMVVWYLTPLSTIFQLLVEETGVPG